MKNLFSKSEQKTIKDIVKEIGVRGGFKYLSFEYINKNGIPHHTRIGGYEFKELAERHLKLFKDLNLPIETKIIK